MKTLYKNSTNSLKSAVDWDKMKTEQARYKEVCDTQRAKVKRLLDSGADSNRIYQDACKLRSKDESEESKAFRVIALGVLRAGPIPYFKRYT